MPIFDYQCNDCGKKFENIEVWSHHKATKCRFCGSTNIERIISSHHVRMDPDTVLHNPPDPVPPLEELRGKGSEGFKDKPYAERDITKGWEYTTDKNGNRIWREKKRIHIDMGRGK